MSYWFIKVVFYLLGIFGLSKNADKIYWNIIHRFRATSKSSPLALERAFQKAKKFNTISNGDYYEFGVFKGYSLWWIQQLAKKYGAKRMRFFGFDSFRGLPQIKDKDDMGEFYEGQFACSKKQVVKNITDHGGSLENIILIEGFFSETLKEGLKRQHNMRKVAIAYIDCDLYESAKDVLTFIKNLLEKNSIVIFDDWNSFGGNKNRGERLALTEFTKKNPQIKFRKIFSYGWHGLAFVVEKA